MASCNFEAPISYYDKRFATDAVKLLPGQYFVTTQNKMLVTVLGSCVAACLFDPVSGIGGMNHFMLPSVNKTAEEFDKMQGMAAKYGVHAMELLINDLVKAGASKKRIKAKIFGGGKVVPSFVQNDVGRFNAEFVTQFLNTERIPILASDLCDTYARKIYFFPSDGNVLMKRIHELNNATIIERESQHRWELSTRAPSGSVDLFED
ncbi:chemotaxis protein CheD [Alteromonas mediterranea]|uniref:chemoreceptor glutamine deamidase CheD n=1 Tax=Alteromonas mediterranea TaxID=314275 RepID=UPI000903EE9B|nr:chemoreceptor glutamine deamidase CheD [Alteromonas mediterranea]APD92764.1 chemotaxis protein CheD [Alteromonas mediterranea]APD96378.1 chemotaxis protein CheD [Alteromonas mediterranea]APE00634.1 chemotaxis protein CheD [Alteromonas mediterranea]